MSPVGLTNEGTGFADRVIEREINTFSTKCDKKLMFSPIEFENNQSKNVISLITCGENQFLAVRIFLANKEVVMESSPQQRLSFPPLFLSFSPPTA